jgi:hypothetical protein
LRFPKLESESPSTSPTLASFTYKVTFDDFAPKAYITITGTCS